MDDRFSDTTGKRIKLLRGYLKLKQDALADRVEEYGASVSRSYLSQIENSSRTPSGEVVAALAVVLGTTSDYLLMLTDDPDRPEERANSEEGAIHIDEDMDRELLQQLINEFSALSTQEQRIVVDLAQKLRAIAKPRIIGDDGSRGEAVPVE